MSKMFVCTLLLSGLSVLSFTPAHAATDAAPQAQPSPLKPQLKGLLDRSGNWLIEQYDVKKKSFKKEIDNNPYTLSFYITTLCEHRRKYSETSGPFISDPVEKLVKFSEELVAKEGFRKDPCVVDIAQALRATQNEKYKPLIEKLLPDEAPAAIEIKTLEELSNPEFKRVTLLDTITTLRALAKDGKKEITIDGKSVNWAETLTAGLLKKEQKGGYFTGDVTTDALVLQLLSLCYKQL